MVRRYTKQKYGYISYFENKDVWSWYIQRKDGKLYHIALIKFDTGYNLTIHSVSNAVKEYTPFAFCGFVYTCATKMVEINTKVPLGSEQYLPIVFDMAKLFIKNRKEPDVDWLKAFVAYWA